MRKTALIWLSLVVPASAQPAPEFPEALLRYTDVSMSEDAFVGRVVDTFRRMDLDGDGLTATDLDRRDQERAAERRAGNVAGIVRADLNNDGRVTAEELQYAKRKSPERYIDPDFDTDGDGVITLEETLKTIVRSDRPDDGMDDLLAMDPDKDGRLTVVELTRLAREAFGKISAGGRVVSQDERLKASVLTPKRHAENCVLESPTPGQKIIAYGTYGGRSYSDVGLSRLQSPVRVVNIAIEAGNEPIYLMLHAVTPTIFRMSGAVGRATTIAIIGARNTGIVGAKAAVIIRNDCYFKFYNPLSPDGAEAARRIEQETGQKVDAIFGKEETDIVHLPSGKTDDGKPSAPPQGVDGKIWQEAEALSPGGVTSIDPETVAGSQAAVKLTVLPAWFGLAQLVGSGALERVDVRSFRILKPFPQYPAGLSGKFKVTFVLPQGVTEPAGDLGQSCLLYEGTSVLVNQDHNPDCRT